jgi:hypothetical protein
MNCDRNIAAVSSQSRGWSALVETNHEMNEETNSKIALLTWGDDSRRSCCAKRSPWSMPSNPENKREMRSERQTERQTDRQRDRQREVSIRERQREKEREGERQAERGVRTKMKKSKRKIRQRMFHGGK